MITHLQKYLFLSFLMIVTSLLSPKTAVAQTGPAELELFFDDAVQTKLEANELAGMTIVVVKDSEVLFSKGYGYANVEQQIPVDPETTLFRIGSATKLFTWTAVMQLAEQGKIDLDSDINSYLDFNIPATYAEPITMRHLLSHTAGFEDRNFGLWATSPETLMCNGDWLKTNIPARVQPASTFMAYSNYGASLAGYIVARVSGMPHSDYVKQNILQPLDMTHSSAQQPLPEDLAAGMANGYQLENGRFTPQPFELLHIAPAGGMSATATDMARFMMAHLGNGRYHNTQILNNATAQQMHSQLFTHHDQQTGIAYGFFEKEQRGQRIIWHGGDTLYFHSQLALLPDANIGFFASCNNAECAGFPQILFDQFITHFYPEVHTTTPTPTANFDTRAELVTGRYRSNRMAHTTAEKVLSLVASTPFQPVQVDDTLLLEVSGLRFVEVEPFVFEQVDGENTLAFHRDAQGTVTHATFGGSTTAFERVPALAAPTLNFALIGISTLLFLSVLIGSPLISLRRRGRDVAAQPGLAQAARWVSAGASLMSILFLGLVVVAGAAGKQGLVTGNLPLINLWPVVFGLIVVLALAALVFSIIVWRNGYWSVFARVHYSLVTLFSWGFIWFVTYWRLLRW